MNMEWLGALLAALTAGYLIFALLYPEKMS
jgi:K+-transporting ATPase KdpF subunit